MRTIKREFALQGGRTRCRPCVLVHASGLFAKFLDSFPIHRRKEGRRESLHIDLLANLIRLLFPPSALQGDEPVKSKARIEAVHRSLLEDGDGFLEPTGLQQNATFGIQQVGMRPSDLNGAIDHIDCFLGSFWGFRQEVGQIVQCSDVPRSKLDRLLQQIDSSR